MGLSLMVENEPGSKMLKDRLERAREELSKIEKEPAAVQYRVIPILAELETKIALYCADKKIKEDEKMFPFTHTYAYLLIRDAARKAEIEKGKGTPSSFRHGFAVNATRAGMPPAVLRQLMGHTNIVSTLVYTNVLEQDARRYLETMRL